MLDKKQQENFKKVRLMTDMLETFFSDIEKNFSSGYIEKEIKINGVSHYVYLQNKLFISEKKATGIHTLNDIERDHSFDFHSMASLILHVILEMELTEENFIEIQKQIIDDI